MKHAVLAQSLRALDTVAGALSLVIDDTLNPVAGSPPRGFDLTKVKRTERSSWTEIDDQWVLTTRLRGHEAPSYWIVSVFEALAPEKQSAVEMLYRLVRLVDSDPVRVLQELDETRLMFQAVLDTIPVRVFWKDLDSVYLGCNRLFAADSGLDEPDELIGKTDYEVGFAAQAELYRSDDRRVMTTGQAKIDYEEPQTTQTGEQIWLQTSKFPIRNIGNEIIGVLGTYRDITRRKEAEAEREALLADLAGKNSELERFTYTVSHDLKSPLVTIGGFLGILEKDLRGSPLDPDAQNVLVDSITRIRKASSKMSQLLDDLLAMSRVGRVLSPPKPIGLRDLVDDALLLCDGPLREAEAAVRVRGDFPQVWVDGPRIVQVFQNLVDNACKYRHPERPLNLRITADSDGTICFSDNGIGIENQYHELIFRLFEKLDPETEGSGIGLALVQRIIECHGGSVRVESDGPGTGTAFRFVLPLAQGAQTPDGSSAIP